MPAGATGRRKRGRGNGDRTADAASKGVDRQSMLQFP
jgi:hypothetical protein